MTDHIPPHDLEAEIAVLGAMLLVTDPADAKAIADIVTGSDFYRSPHGDVFLVQVDLWETKAACDVLLLRNELQETGKLEQVGGTSFVSRIIASVPSAANAPHYARIVRKRRLERDVLDATAFYEQEVRESGNGTATAAFARLATATAAKDEFEHPVTVETVASSWDFADLAIEEDDPPPDEFVSRLFVRPSFNLVFGPPQAGKSWAVMALCLDAVMGGGNFLGCEELYIKPLRDLRDGKPERVLWVFGTEDTRARVKRRLKTLHASGPHAGKDIPRGSFIVASPPDGASLHTPAGWRWLVAKVKATEATILVLDTIASLTGSTLDVKKDEQVVPFMTQVNRLRSELGLIVFGLHHTRKGSSDAKKGSESKADAMLGSQAWRALSEGVLMLDALDGDTSKVKAISVKAKDIDRPLPPVLVTLESPSGRFRQLDEDETPAEREQVRSGRQSKCSVDNVLTLRRKHPDGVLWREIREKLDIPDGTWKNHSSRLQSDLLAKDHVVIEGFLRWSKLSAS